MAGDSGKTASGQQAEPIVELSRNILRTEYLHAGGGKFHSKGDTVQSVANLRHRSGILFGQREAWHDGDRPVDESL